MLLTRLPARAVRPSRLIAASLALALGGAGVLTGAVAPASAADGPPVTTFAELEAAFGAGGTVQLGADITGAGLVVTSGTDVTLDLGGHELTVTGSGNDGNQGGHAGIGVEAGASFTVDGPGTLRATGGSGTAGIGGRAGWGAGTVVIDGGTVVATGGLWAPGIGAGDGATGDPGSVTINGGTVTATGSSIGGAGIGGGFRGVTPVLTIAGGTVTATGGAHAAGIGSGWEGRGLPATISILGGVVDARGYAACSPGIGTSGQPGEGGCVWGLAAVVTIGDLAHVTASTSATQGVPTPAVYFVGSAGGGSFENSGTLVMPSGTVLDIPAGASVLNEGVLLGAVTGEVRGNSFLLSFDANRGTGAPSAVRVYAPTLEKAQLAVPGGATWEGTTFVGWSSSSTPGVGTMLTTTTALSTATWYASWQGTPAHTVTFVTDGGSTVAPVSVADGATLTLPPDPAKSGSVFAGWYTAAAGGAGWSAATPITAPTTLYARWTTNSYTVTFDTGPLGSLVPPQTVLHGEPAVEPGWPTREGHLFTGWYTAETGGTAWNADVAVVESATVYAQWAARTYTVVFISNNGTPAHGDVVAYGELIVEPAVPVRDGYTLLGWFATGSEVTWDFDVDVVTGGDMVLTAHWAVSSYAVTFATAGGATVAGQTIAHGAKIVEPEALTRTGYTFVGWFAPGSGTDWAFDTDTVTGATVLTARWTLNTYAVTFASAGGGPVASQTIAHGATIVEPEALTRTGHTFVGWFAPGGATAWDFDDDAVTGPTALTARWTVNSYAVTFATAGGGPVTAQTIDYGATIVEPEALTRVGYTFVGWFAPSSSTAWDFAADTVTGATALTAHWTLNTYAVTFDGAGSGPVGSQTVEHGAQVDEPEAPTRTGYTFVGWFAPGSATAWDFGSDTVTGAVALVAHWSERTSVVVSVSPEGSVVVGAAVTVKGTVTPVGATGTVELFDGGTSLGSGPVSSGAFSVITTTLGEGDRVLTAVFTPADALFDGSTSDPVGLRVNAKAAQGPAPAASTDDLLDLVDENGWPILPDGATVAWPDALDSFVDVWVYSTPVALGVLPVVEGKVQRDTLALPSLAPGVHHLVFVGQTTGKVTVIEFVVPEPTTEEPGTTPPGTPPPGTTPPPSTQAPALAVTGGAPGTQPTAVGLATTGATLAPMLALAGAVLALGVLLVSARPRRRRSTM